MVSAENKPKKRKDEKKNPWSAWEGADDADNGWNDDNAFYGCQRAKQQVKQKCRYLDEKNIVVSRHLLSEALSSSSEGSDVSEKLTPGCKAFQDNTPPIQSPVVLPAEESSLSQSTSDTDRFPANKGMITNLVIHKRDIICGLRSVKTSSLELKRTLPLIRWAPATSCVQMTEEPVAWRYKGFVTVNREASHGELPQLWKRASGKKLERCHGSLANMALPQMQSPNKALSVTRTRPVIRKAARLTTGHRGVQVRDSHVKQNFCWKIEAKHTDLLYSGSAPLEDTHKKVLNKYVCSATKSESSISMLDDDHYHRTEGLNPMCYTNVSRLPDIMCQSGCRGDSETSTILHDVTLFHMLQALQSQPVNFPQVRVQRRLEAL